MANMSTVMEITFDNRTLIQFQKTADLSTKDNSH